MKLRSHTLLTLISGALCSVLAAVGQPTPIAPYTVSVFATGVPNMYTQPDSIAVSRDGIFIGYGNGVCKDGTCPGASSTIVQYSTKGTVIKIYSVPGHNDGLKAEPKTHRIWALQNEDGLPNLVIIDSKKGTQTPYSFGPTPHGGGYDDIAFIHDDDQEQETDDEIPIHDVFISASNPLNNPNVSPAIVRGHLNQDGTVSVSPVLLGNATATDVTTGGSVTLNLQDPDSMIFDPSGNLVLDSQADSELIIVHDPGSADDHQSVFRLGLANTSEQVDDTVFATSSHGLILVSDRDANAQTGIVYAITNPKFAPEAAYTAALTSVGKLDFHTGVITPVVTGMVSPHGMAFIGRERER